jgi:divalent metal cation (Fe/Co/Zn/Cd) transporter
MTNISTEDNGENHKERSVWFRLVRVLWFVFAVFVVGVILASLPVYWQNILDNLHEINNSSEITFTLYLVGDLTSIMAVVVSFLVAVLLFWRKADDVMALSISFFLLAYSITLAGPLEHIQGIYNLPDSIIVVAHSFLLTISIIAFAFLFPNGRFVPLWTRWALLVAIIAFLLLTTTPTDQWFTSSSFLQIMVTTVIAISWILGAYAQVYRYRNVSNYSERQQTKWVMFGILLYQSLLLLAAVMAELIPTDSLSGVSRAGWESLNTIVWWLSFCILPVTIFIAILRYNLYDIDIIIRRTLVYGALTLLLVVVYFGSVVLLQQVFRALTGQDSPIAIVISTLVIAALFNPLRNRIQEAIDRRFYRRKYNAQQALAAFATTARDEVDMDKLTASLLDVVEETIQPETTSLWIISNKDR